MGEWGEGDGGGHPAGEVGFEGFLVDVAVAVFFAGEFAHDVVVAEEDVDSFEDIFDALAP